MIRSALLAAFLSCFAVTAFAHSKLSGSSPSDGAVLAAFPQTMQLSYHKKIRLTKVALRAASGGSVLLELDGHKSFAKDFSLPMPEQPAGHYFLEWRGLGEDGHALKGTLRFKVK